MTCSHFRFLKINIPHCLSFYSTSPCLLSAACWEGRGWAIVNHACSICWSDPSRTHWGHLIAQLCLPHPFPNIQGNHRAPCCRGICLGSLPGTFRHQQAELGEWLLDQESLVCRQHHFPKTHELNSLWPVKKSISSSQTNSDFFFFT